jgi:hypothetical protein
MITYYYLKAALALIFVTLSLTLDFESLIKSIERSSNNYIKVLEYVYNKSLCMC